jgi:rSAM/selenodomain-associated transferase 1
MTELVVFAKYWEPGKVKTRLAAGTDDQTASCIYHAFVDCILQRFQQTASHRHVCISPANRRDAFYELIGQRSWSITCQSEGDLGFRMQAMFSDRLSRNSSGRVVLIGSDSPDLPTSYVEQAFDLLCDHDVVLGPTSDGGYYLIGLSVPVPEIFVDMPWSSDQVLAQTVAVLRTLGRSFVMLPEWADVDEHDDLRRLWDSLVDRDDLDEGLAVLKTRLAALRGSVFAD